MLHLDATADCSSFADRKARFGGAFGTAVATHALIVLVFWGLIRVQPAVRPSPQASRLDITRFIFPNTPGDSGGGGGGGNRSAAPAAGLQTQPADAIAVSVAKPTPQTPPQDITQETPHPLDALVVPLQPMDAGQVPRVGMPDGPSAPPSDVRGPGVGGGTDAGKGTGSGPGEGPGLGPGVRGGFGDGVHQIGGDVVSPQIRFKTSPQYTAESMRAKIQGVALLTGVVAPDGTLHDIRIARSLDGTFGLDQEAIKCVRQWRFRPGTKAGRPVAVYVTIEVAFNLR